MCQRMTHRGVCRNSQNSSFTIFVLKSVQECLALVMVSNVMSTYRKLINVFSIWINQQNQQSSLVSKVKKSFFKNIQKIEFYFWIFEKFAVWELDLPFFIISITLCLYAIHFCCFILLNFNLRVERKKICPKQQNLLNKYQLKIKCDINSL